MTKYFKLDWVLVIANFYSITSRETPVECVNIILFLSDDSGQDG